VATLISRELSTGEHRVQWDAGKIASGVYVYQLQAGNFVARKKLVLLQ